MKKIYSDTYMNKNSQYRLPGDPSLPPGVSMRDIDNSFGGDEPARKVVYRVVYDIEDNEMPVTVVFDGTYLGDEVEIDIVSIAVPGTNEDVSDKIPDREMLRLKAELAFDYDVI